ncbi:MAG: cell wall hydrolase [Pseudomonadota bacterium]
MRFRLSAVLCAVVLLLAWWVPFGVHAQSLFAASTAQTGVFPQRAATLVSSARAPLVTAPKSELVERAMPLIGSHRSPVPGTWRPGNVQPTAELLQEAERLKTSPPRNFADETTLQCIAVSIYHEARNQSHAGQLAVASVILTRAARTDRWGMTPCEVVVPVQFSYLTASRRFAPIMAGNAWDTAVDLAVQAMTRGPDPALRDADHYHATYVDPPWNRAMDLVVQIEDHIFWRSRSAEMAALNAQ